MIRSNDSLKRNEGTSQVCLSSGFIPPGLGDSEVGQVGDSMQPHASTAKIGSLACIDSENGFFQSKLNVAEKLTEKHNKEIIKRSGIDLAQLCPDYLTASQLASFFIFFLKKLFLVMGK